MSLADGRHTKKKKKQRSFQRKLRCHFPAFDFFFLFTVIFFMSMQPFYRFDLCCSYSCIKFTVCHYNCHQSYINIPANHGFPAKRVYAFWLQVRPYCSRKEIKVKIWHYDMLHSRKSSTRLLVSIAVRGGMRHFLPWEIPLPMCALFPTLFSFTR